MTCSLWVVGFTKSRFPCKSRDFDLKIVFRESELRENCSCDCEEFTQILLSSECCFSSEDELYCLDSWKKK